MAEYCLRWNNYLPNLVNVFSELRQAEGLVDVTLTTDGHHIRAHKLVLSACSVYFKELFGLNPCTHPIVFLKDIRYDDLKTVIDFIYKGEVNVAQERLPDVLKTAESLKIKGLADKPFNAHDQSSQGPTVPLSSSSSSQMSSVNESRNRRPSMDAEERECASPVSKRRKVLCQDSTESQHDSGHDSEERSRCTETKELTSPDKEGQIIPTIKQETDAAAGGANPETESGAVDAMLLLQGSSSETETTGGRTSTPSNGRDSANLLAAQSQGSVMCRWGTSACALEALLDNPLSSSPPSSSSSSPPLFVMGASSPSTPSPAPHHPSHLFFAAAAAAAAAGTLNSSSCGAMQPLLMPYSSWHNQFRRMSPNMLLAIDAVRSGRMGFTQAGKTFGVNGRTLWVYYRKLGYEVHNTFRGKRNRQQQPTLNQGSLTASPRPSGKPLHVRDGPDTTLMPSSSGTCVSAHVQGPKSSFSVDSACDSLCEEKAASPGLPPASPSEIIPQISHSLPLGSPPGQSESSFATKSELNYNNFSSLVAPNQCRYSATSPASNFMNCLYPVGTNGCANPFDRDPVGASGGAMPPPSTNPYANEPVLDPDDGNSIESLLESCNLRNIWSASL